MKKQITRRNFLRDCVVSSIGLVGLTLIPYQETTRAEIKEQVRYWMKKAKIGSDGIFYAQGCHPDEWPKGFSVNKNNLDEFPEGQLKKTLADLKIIDKGRKKVQAMIRDYTRSRAA